MGSADRVRVLAAVAAMAALAGCGSRRVTVQPAPVVSGPAHVDLQAGWRVRVVTPILRSGRFLLDAQVEREEANTITLRASDEVLGYETATYAVRGRDGGGVRIALAEVELSRDGEITHPARSAAPRLRMSGRMRHVRLLFMQKASDADHNMAVLAAAVPEQLEELTQRVQTSPAAGCRGSRNSYCAWIPAGVAVRAERPNGAGWAPAR